ncbi:MAG: hypothetical protein M1834_000679 [Cirrosporium novae-zelandiae]|nr:MAG: hypothetical protein M1834_000679 [Cirrosporium novae-zelandiae]
MPTVNSASTHVPPRQKSCTACKKAKRRCDLKTPRCTRCAGKEWQCEYPGLACARQNCPSEAVVGQKEGDLWLGNLEGLVTTQPIDGGLEANMDGSAPLFDNFTNVEDMILETLPVIGDSTADDGSSEYTTLDTDQLSYTQATFKSFPRLLVFEGETPFIHRHLYDNYMPSTIQDLLAVSALYAAKSPAQEDLVFRVLDAKVTRLVNRGDPWTLGEHLACVQALTIYQIIRLFDGDIRQRSIAEAQMPILATWVEELNSRFRDPGSIENAIEASNWRSYIFAESVRRSVIFGYLVQGVYRVCRRGWCSVVGTLVTLPFTAQKRLWKAKSAFHWQKVYREHRAWEISEMEFTDFLEDATADDADDVSIMMMVLCKGCDGANAFLEKNNAPLLMV